MGNRYSQLSTEDRNRVQGGLNLGLSRREVGRGLGRAPSAMSREATYAGVVQPRPFSKAAGIPILGPVTWEPRVLGEGMAPGWPRGGVAGGALAATWRLWVAVTQQPIAGVTEAPAVLVGTWSSGGGMPQSL